MGEDGLGSDGVGADRRSAKDEAGNPAGRGDLPLLANCYFRRFLLAWHNHGHRDQLDAHVVNYADDFVICCRPGNAPAAMARMATLMTRFGLEVNAKKALVQIAGAGKRPVLYCRDFKLGARHSTLQAQVDLGHPDVPVRIVPCGCYASIRYRRS